ncbi:hypothetical protein [Desulfitobacterium metallireducens]|uniref:Uncharacterized protein n=1 Tax=Desulfitobacterium metallireducens DSM 15288 TaxID=871968 RepID=W0E7J5_9FIRM|nr:hypothetical protein [Desulfitobacterium metallireducens]AHF06830.1 hypothetical protein DESME_06960 [Desulfitobacterium metallireducens DSM 15288]
MPSKKEWDWSTTIVTFSTVIFAIVSLITAYITITSWQTQRQADRPYFSVKNSPQVVLQKKVMFEFEFTNVGKHAASTLVSNTYVFDQSLNLKPVHVDEYALINDIPRETTTRLMIQLDNQDISLIDKDINPQYLVIHLSYADPVLNQSYQQSLFMKWAGVVDEEVQPLIYAQTSEREKILNYLKLHHLKV